MRREELEVIYSHEYLKNLSNKDKKYNHVRSLLVLHGIRNRDLARAIGVSEAFVSMVLHGKEESRRVKQFIAQALGIKVEKLWDNANRKAA